MKFKLLPLIIGVCFFQFAIGQKTQNDTTDTKDVEEIALDTVSYFSYYCSGKTSNCLIYKSEKYFTVKILDSANKTTNNTFNLEIDFSDKELNSWLNGVNKECTEKNDLLTYKIRQKIGGFIEQEKKQADFKIVDSIAAELDKDIVAGELYNTNKIISIYNKDSLAYLRTGAIKDTFFIINNIRTQIDYNRLYDITVDGTLVMKSPDGKKETKLPLVLSNGEFSVSFLGLNKGWFILKLPVIQSHSLFINYADVVQYRPSKREFSTIVRNQTLQISPKGNAKVMKRSFSDYVSFRTFLDPLGFLGKNPNGFAQLEGDAILPLRLTNWRRQNFLPQANFTFSYIYSNSINSEPRIAPVYQLKNTNTSGFGDDTSRFNNNIDVIKYAYYQFNARLSVYALEFKRLNSWLHFELGARVAGSKVGDTINNKLVHKLIPEAQLRLEIRPDYVIGASIALGLAWLGNSHRGNNSPNNINDISFLYNSAFAIPHEVNIYAMTGNGKGGLFFRYAGWLAFNQKLSTSIDKTNLPPNSEIKKTSYFPQILVGYSTNLSALIKRSGSERVYR